MLVTIDDVYENEPYTLFQAIFSDLKNVKDLLLIYIYIGSTTKS